MSVTFYVTADPFNTELPTLNVSNANARDLLELLGFHVDEDLSGEIPAGELRARATRLLWPERRLMLERESLRLSTTSRVPGRATVVECGRRDDYFEDRLSRLVRIAEAALEIEGEAATVTFA